MQFGRILVVYLVLLIGLLLTAALIGFPASLAAGPPTETLQVVKMLHSSHQKLAIPPVGRLSVIQRQLDSSSLPSPAVRPTTLISNSNGWQKIMLENFEGTFPQQGWLRVDRSLTDGGEYLWGQRNCRARSGSYSVWAGGGGINGEVLPCGATYPNNLKTWLRYGPIDLSQVTDAELQFDLWADIERLNLVDYISWMASIDGEHFHGYATDRQTGGWAPLDMNLTRVYELGDLTGKPAVYFAWLFVSNYSIAYEGAFVDDVALWVYTPPSPLPPPPPSPTLPITRHTTLADFASGRSHDGTMVIVEHGDGALAPAAQANTLGAWERLPSLPKRLFDFAAVTAQGRLFIIGGNCPSDDINPNCGVEQQVYSAPLGQDGRLGHWQETTPLPQALAGHSTAVANGYLFVVGGWNALGAQQKVFSARIQPDGNLSEWFELPQLPEKLIDPVIVAAHGYLYVLGGQRPDFSASNKVYRTAINADGTIEAWLPPTLLPVVEVGMSGLDDFVALSLSDHLYILGGNDHELEWNGVFRAPINADGSLGSWIASSPLPRTLSFHAGAASRAGILIAGGLNSTDFGVLGSQKEVYWAAVQPDGGLGSWTPEPDLFYPMSNQELVINNLYAYNLGGINQQSELIFSSVLVAPLQPTSQVLTSSFNHQFELGQNYFIKHLHWQEEGSLGQIQIRYRVASATGVYGPWSTMTSTQLITVNAIGSALEYQFLYQRQGNIVNDKIIPQIEIELGQNTAPSLLDLPNQTLMVNTSLDNAIDLWAYASDNEFSDDELTFTGENIPDPNAGVSIDRNRYIDLNPTLAWTGQTSVTIQVVDPGGLSDTGTFSVTVKAEPNKAIYLPVILK